MVEVFITDIKKQARAKKVVKTLRHIFSELKIDFDMDETGLPFPMGHTVLRAEGEHIDADEIIWSVKKLGFSCSVMEDAIYQMAPHKKEDN